MESPTGCHYLALLKKVVSDMNTQEMLMMILGEEACEVGQMASKINRFGMHEVFHDPVNNPQNLTNAQRMYKELDDLNAMVDLINQMYGFEYTPNQQNIIDKQKRVMHYLEYSQQLGTLES